MSTKAQDLMKIATEWAVDGHFQDMYGEECSEAIWNFLIAERAESEGYPEVAEIIREVAKDELKHALWMGQIAKKRDLERRSLAEHIEGMLSGDDAVVNRERRIAAMARLLGREEDAARFEQMANDELNHVEKFKKSLALLKQRTH